MLLRSLIRLNGTKTTARSVRKVSILSSLESSPVLISSNKDIYTNLALEHWLFTNLNFQNKENDKSQSYSQSKLFQKPVVLIWTDEPCVVMGRHQNPWVESNLGFINRTGLKLARRHSGGGCVYHDESNINISIIGHRNTFENRQENLRFLANIIDEKYGIKCQPTQRHDLIHSGTGLKITGSAAKLGRFNCYHHFTVLVNTDKEALYTSIRQNQQDFIKTNSSLSTRSKIINLKDIKPDIEVQQVISDLADAYSKLYRDPSSKQSARKDRVEGDQTDYNNLNEMREELQSWNWLYGMTPKFQLERCYNLIESGNQKLVKFTVEVNKGLFSSIKIDGDIANNPTENFQHLIGSQFTYKEAIVKISNMLQIDEEKILKKPIGLENLFATFLLQMVHESNY